GAPVSLAEMAATGMAVVATTHCDIPQVVLDGVTGYLAPEHDVDALVALMERFAAHPGCWRTMGLAARRHVETWFDARAQGLELAGRYAALLGRA
ncbi:MAG TPA: glycosyltransferase, partial [Longimicrobiaceae bacterium]|nr:glycosyltransferase [Longimicrobiaceae bacterium]